MADRNRGNIERPALATGAYEALLTDDLQRRLAEVRDDFRKGAIDGVEAPQLLADHVRQVLRRALETPGVSGNLQRQTEICNGLINSVSQLTQKHGDTVDDLIVDPAELLLEVHRANESILAKDPLPRPSTPLRQNALMVRAPGEPSLAAELRRELATADGVDLICAFVIWTGVRVLLPEIEELQARGQTMRILTTTYTGTTDERALEELIARGAKVKVSYDIGNTRLHAKAWLFRRNSGFSTAYVGSSNLTHTAIHDGLEWNVRLAQSDAPELLTHFQAAFETYWQDPTFENYDRGRFREALGQQRASDASFVAPFTITPLPFQAAILERLQVERERHNHWRNLIVAATGTGKTVLAALDYADLAQRWKRRPSLLFVAHREEILKQTVATFRTVLRDGAFGALLVGSFKPTDTTHLFASIQSLNTEALRTFDPESYEVVIVDEFHHAAAKTYTRLLDFVRPKVLLGLTATPERTDGLDITRWFDGRIAVELRLWDALQQELLCPFQYFGLADDVDLSAIEWKRTGYAVAELSRVYTGNDARVSKVLAAIERIVEKPLEMRALGFCVSVEHAEYMSRKFNEAGIPAVAISGATPRDQRAEALAKLRQGEVNVLFSVDLFNEGLDIPGIDTLLFLRPTESATLFMQQFGRGLRRETGKTSLTVLDFIGPQNRNFRFEPRYAALTGSKRRQLLGDVANDFPFLPAGCSITLDRVARDVILENLRASIRGRRAGLVKELEDLGDVGLGAFLTETGRDLSDVYRAGGWTGLRREAGFARPPGPDEEKLAGAIGRMRHIDDPLRVAEYRQWTASAQPPDVSGLDPRQTRLLTMLHFDLWGRQSGFGNPYDSAQRIWEHPDLMAELNELLEILDDRAVHVAIEPDLEDSVPLLVHERYTRDEVLAGFGDATAERPPSSREGVKYLAEDKTDVFFVTLNKSEERFSPSTMYRDYAISPGLFHWESQSTTSENSPTGLRYQEHDKRGGTVLLFARETVKDADNGTMPFLFLGPAHYVSHESERPLQITWRLEHPIPGDFFQLARAAA
jgi:superfamily II DNA or RNA helicase